ncbi:hypothetical protein [Streptomyces sp. NPDC007346]|uniref:hypothetical protein n=1 Tax=Streptomyces sp. NPDC007346 TaxID=3154682 RepID=UPI0034566134
MGIGMGTGAKRWSVAVHEAPALAVFLGLVPLSVFAATAVWALDGDRERRFLLLMLCLGPAAVAVLALGAYQLLRGVQRTAGVVAAALHDGSGRAGPAPALPDSVPGRAGWRLLTWAYGTAFVGGLVGFWFLGVGDPGQDGRLHSTGELWVWGGALAVIALYCALNVEGSVPRVLPGRTRALRGTVRRGKVVAARGGGPRGPLRVDLRVPGADFDELAAGMEGRRLWLCWDLRQVKRDFVQEGPPRLDCAALLVFDGGQAVRARALFPPDRSPWAEGAPTGSPQAPVDPARKVAAWTPRSLWPLTLPAPAYGLYALAGLCAGGLFTEGAPRGLLAVVGACALLFARGQHAPDCERALAPGWYRDRSPARPDTAPDGSPLPVERAEPGTARIRRALRRLPALVSLATLVPLSALVGLAAWLTWPGREARLAVTAGCLAVAAGVLAVLLVHRIATGPVHPHEIEAARGAVGGVRDSARRLRLRKARYLFGAIGVGGWLAGLVFLMPAGDVTSSPLLDRLRAEGAVVAEVTVEGTSLVERHYKAKKGGGRGPQYAVTEKLSVRLPTDSGSFDFATVRTMSAQERRTGDRVTVIYAPGNTALGAYVGDDSREGPAAWLSNWQGYPDDLQRLLDDRALSGRQLGGLGGLWLLCTGVCVWVAHNTRVDGPDHPPSWPLTITYTSFVTAALALAGSALLLTDLVLGFGRLVLGAFTACCAVLSLTMRFAGGGDEGDAARKEGRASGRA